RAPRVAGRAPELSGTGAPGTDRGPRLTARTCAPRRPPPTSRRQTRPPALQAHHARDAAPRRGVPPSHGGRSWLTPRRSVSALAPAAGSHEALWEAPDLPDPCEIHHLRPRPHPARFVASSREGSHVTPGLVGLGVLFYWALADDVGGGFVVFGAFFAGFRRLGDASGARGVIRTESTSEPSHFRQSAILASEGCSGGGKTPKDALNPFNSRE